ncbi:hypothetical protein ACOMHN_046541 [Nucella lapillus]
MALGSQGKKEIDQKGEKKIEARQTGYMAARLKLSAKLNIGHPLTLLCWPQRPIADGHSLSCGKVEAAIGLVLVKQATEERCQHHYQPGLYNTCSLLANVYDIIMLSSNFHLDVSVLSLSAGVPEMKCLLRLGKLGEHLIQNPALV